MTIVCKSLKLIEVFMAGRHVYEPDAKGEFLVTSDGARIECTPHLYFLVRKNVTSPYEPTFIPITNLT